MIPHPSLPFFITYGIDPTAKLWRATIPVDSNVDDSAEVRATGILVALVRWIVSLLKRVFVLL